MSVYLMPELQTAEEQQAMWQDLLGQNHSHAQRALTPAERRVDFAAIKSIYDNDAVKLGLRLRDILKTLRHSTLDLIERQAQHGLSADFAQSIRLSAGPEFAQAVEAYLMDVWRRNRDLALAELPGELESKLGLRLKGYHLAGTPDDHDQEDHGNWADGGHSLPTTVYRGGIEQETSASWSGKGVYVSTDKKSAGQWGGVVEYVQIKAPKLLDLGNWNAQGAKKLVADLTGQKVGQLSFQDYDIAAGELFIQMPDAFIVRLRRNGWDGVRLGRDAFLIGKLTDYYKPKQKAYASSFTPDVAGNYFRNRALFVAGIIEDEILKQVKFEVFEFLKGGQNLNEAMGRLREIFEPWVGDESVIVPSGMSDTPEDVLQAHRLENLLRTETTLAVNQGRRAVADAAEGFVLGFRHSSILDLRTTTVCQLADELTYRKDSPQANKLAKPLHWNCRSIDVFVTTNDTPVDWSTDAQIDAVIREIPKGFK